jgi:hypothetical protein
MLITTTVISILAISTVVWFVNRFTPITVCPVCAGVFITWMWLVIAHTIGYQIDLVVPALLMGGSVVGIAYQTERKLKNLPAGRIIFWKILFIPSGFAAAYGILEQLSTVLVVAIIFLLMVSLLLVKKTNTRNESASGLEKKMEDCC